MVTIIIPTLNEAELLPATLTRLGHREDQEIIVADGGSSDATLEIAKKFGIQVVKSKPVRATQLNSAARMAQGRFLIFLHADTQLPYDYWLEISRILEKTGVSAGAFSLRIRGKSWGFRVIELGTNLRSRLFSTPYGDQALFLSASTFRETGGFVEIPIMEDFELVRRLAKSGRIVISQKTVTTSARRWNQLGLFLTTIYNWCIVLAYWWGVSPRKLAVWYRQASALKGRAVSGTWNEKRG